MEIETVMSAGGLHDDGGKLARSQDAVAHHVMTKRQQLVRPAQYVAYVAHPGPQGNALLAVQSLAVFVGDETLRQLERRQYSRPMPRIGNPRMMQAAHKVADTQAALGRGREGEAPAAVDAFIRYVIAMRDAVTGAVLFQGSNGS